MRDILSRANRIILEQVAWSNVLIGFDFDGTLAPIVSRPGEATMRSSTRRLLVRLSRLYRVVVVSGRARDDVAARVRGTGLEHVIGNHGIEPTASTPRLRALVAAWRLPLEAAVAPFRGVFVENKTYSLAIHVRHCRTKRAAIAALRAATRSLGPHRWIDGKEVVNLLPPGAPHKGVALERARVQLGCDTALYVGDDETDEDVFALDQPGQLLGIRVGRRISSRAAYYVRDQRHVDDLLRALVALRREGARGAAP